MSALLQQRCLRNVMLQRSLEAPSVSRRASALRLAARMQLRVLPPRQWLSGCHLVQVSLGK